MCKQKEKIQSAWNSIHICFYNAIFAWDRAGEYFMFILWKRPMTSFDHICDSKQSLFPNFV